MKGLPPKQVDDRLPCPFCAEMIIPAAVVCRFCDRELPSNWATAARAATQQIQGQSSPRPRIRPAIRNAGLLTLLLAVAIAVFQSKRDDNSVPSSPDKADSHPAASPSENKGSDSCREYTTDSQRDAARRMIQARGYDCKTVDAMCPYILSEGFTAYCNKFRYVFEIENHGGKWSVKPQ